MHYTSDESKKTLGIARETVSWVRQRIFAPNDPRNSFGQYLKEPVVVENRGDKKDLAGAIIKAFQTGVGHCAEMAMLAMAYIEKMHPDHDYDLLNTTQGDHVFLIIKPKTLPNLDDNWVICDPWANIACRWNERFLALDSLNKSLMVSAQLYIKSYIEQMELIQSECSHLRAAGPEEKEHISMMIFYATLMLISGQMKELLNEFPIIVDTLYDDTLEFYPLVSSSTSPIFKRILETYVASREMKMDARLRDPIGLTAKKILPTVIAEIFGPSASLASSTSVVSDASPISRPSSSASAGMISSASVVSDASPISRSSSILSLVIGGYTHGLDALASSNVVETNAGSPSYEV